jgi:uncharacterized protein (UPF0332 family)
MVRKIAPTRENISRYLNLADENIISAKALLKLKHYNIAISRVYYGFFYAASAALASKGFFASTHKGVGLLFDNYFVKTGEMPPGAGKWLARARTARENADYELWKKYNEEQVSSAIKAAEDFVGRIRKLLEENLKAGEKL